MSLCCGKDKRERRSRITIKRTVARRVTGSYSFGLAFLMVALVPVAIHANIRDSVDTSEARRSMRTSFTAPAAEIALRATRVIGQSGGRLVRYSAEASSDSVYQIFAPEHAGAYPVFGAGTYIVRHDRRTASIDQVKVFLLTHPGFFVRIFPDGERSRMDLYVNHVMTYRNVRIPFEFDRVLTEPFSRIVESTRSIVAWDIVSPDVGDSRHLLVAGMVDSIRAALPSLEDADDGAMDVAGNAVFISTREPQLTSAGMNCSGFAKWVADGLFGPRTGGYLTIDRLSERHHGMRGTGWSAAFEDERDPFFGLDWTRNIATALSESTGRSPSVRDRDVRTVRYSRYVENVGYPIDELGRILYLLALESPGEFYFGSVNREFNDVPRLRRHSHVVVLFPYFDSRGRFQAVVMERNVETDVGSLVSRYKGAGIHLVSASADDTFDPARFNVD